MPFCFRFVLQFFLLLQLRCSGYYAVVFIVLSTQLSPSLCGVYFVRLRHGVFIHVLYTGDLGPMPDNFVDILMRTSYLA